jgi:tetraacyldisaccharide 4'-kinase
MRLVGRRFHRLDDARTTCSAAEFVGQRLHAVAGIGDPQRFFSHLRAMGLDCVAHPFADHHRYRREDLIYDGDAILTTEKDAVKLARLEAPLPIWVLPVTAELAPDLAAFIVERLNGRPPA